MFVAATPEDGHVYGQVSVAYALQPDTGQHALASADDVDESPGKNHSKDEFDYTVYAGGDKRGIVAGDACVCEDLERRFPTSVQSG